MCQSKWVRRDRNWVKEDTGQNWKCMFSGKWKCPSQLYYIYLHRIRTSEYSAPCDADHLTDESVCLEWFWKRSRAKGLELFWLKWSLYWTRSIAGACLMVIRVANWRWFSDKCQKMGNKVESGLRRRSTSKSRIFSRMADNVQMWSSLWLFYEEYVH